MRKLNGVFLILLGAVFLYLFAISGVVGVIEKGLASIDEGMEKKGNVATKDNDVVKGGVEAIRKATAGGTTLPFHALGINYPNDVIMFMIGAICLCWGIALLFPRSRPVAPTPATTEGAVQDEGAAKKLTARLPVAAASFRVSTLFFVNAVLLLFCEWAAYVGAPYEGNERSVAVFFLTIGAQIVCGLVLAVMTIRDRTKSLPALVAGGGLFAAGIAVAVLSVMWGM